MTERNIWGNSIVAGFFKRLFGSKNVGDAASQITDAASDAVKKAPEAVKKAPEAVKKAPEAVKKAVAYFLDSDDAKTYGNLEYMRTAKLVKRSFPKTAGSTEEKRFEQEVSAMMARKSGANGAMPTPTTAASETATPNTPKVDAAAERRRTDTSMDMFRNMARDIRK